MTIRCLAILTLLCISVQPCFSLELKKQENTKRKAKTHHLSSSASKVSEAFKMQSDNLRKLMLQLYECNQQDLLKSTKVSAEELAQWVFEGPFGWKFDAIRQAQSIDALSLGFNEEYQGDRILPIITGLHTMLLTAYGGESEFKFTKKISSHNLYYAAHNIQITQFKLINTANNIHHFNADCTHNQVIDIQNTLTKLAQRSNQDAQHLEHNNLMRDSKEPVNFDSAEFINIQATIDNPR